MGLKLKLQEGLMHEGGGVIAGFYGTLTVNSPEFAEMGAMKLATPGLSLGPITPQIRLEYSGSYRSWKIWSTVSYWL